MNALIRTSALVKTYRQNVALRGLDLPPARRLEALAGASVAGHKQR